MALGLLTAKLKQNTDMNRKLVSCSTGMGTLSLNEQLNVNPFQRPSKVVWRTHRLDRTPMDIDSNGLASLWLRSEIREKFLSHFCYRSDLDSQCIMIIIRILLTLKRVVSTGRLTFTVPRIGRCRSLPSLHATTNSGDREGKGTSGPSS